MAITSTNVLINIPHGATHQWVRIEYIFGSGERMAVDNYLPNATDVDAWIVARIPEIESARAEAEFAEIIRGAP